MPKNQIITLPNSKLRTRSNRVSKITASTLKIIKTMISFSLDWEDSRPHEISAAMAAVQINELKRIIIIRNDFEDKNNREFTALINPEIIKAEGELIKDYEGCLSVPDIYGLVSRYDKIRVKALNQDGLEIRFRANGFLARTIQHEVDHINGIVFIDHIKNDSDAFFRLDKSGNLQPVNYEKIRKNHILW